MVGGNEHMITLLGSLFGEELSFNDFFWLIITLSFLPIKYTYWLLFASCGIFPFGELKRVYILYIEYIYIYIQKDLHTFCNIIDPSIPYNIIESVFDAIDKYIFIYIYIL